VKDPRSIGVAVVAAAMLFYILLAGLVQTHGRRCVTYPSACEPPCAYERDPLFEPVCCCAEAK